MEVPRQPGRIMHHVIQLIGRVNDPGNATENKQDQAPNEVSKQEAILVEPGKLFHPAK